MNEPRSEMVTIRLTAEEHARAEAVADYHGVNVAALFRMLVKKEQRTIGVDEPAAKKRKEGGR